MAILTLTFSADVDGAAINGLNPEIQIGDKVYYVATTTNGGFTTNNGDIVEVGTVLTVNFSKNVMTITTDLADNTVTTSHYILFSKDNDVNMSSILGYYAEVKIVNNSTSQAELYQVSTDMFESSGNS